MKRRRTDPTSTGAKRQRWVGEEAAGARLGRGRMTANEEAAAVQGRMRTRRWDGSGRERAGGINQVQ